jgi:hypothetical protein
LVKELEYWSNGVMEDWSVGKIDPFFNIPLFPA